MKKILFTLLFVFNIGYVVKAQEDMIVLRDDLDSCNIVRPDVMPKDFQLDYASLYYYNTAAEFRIFAIQRITSLSFRAV